MQPQNHIYLPSAKSSCEIGRKLGHGLTHLINRAEVCLPFLITLSGELGAGKTTLCQGLGEALGVSEPGEIVSPTFTLANEYHGHWDIFHLDIYRLENVEQFYEAGLDEYLYRTGICLIEWPEKMPDGFWPEKRLDLRLDFKGAGRTLLAEPEVLWSKLMSDME